MAEILPAVADAAKRAGVDGSLVDSMKASIGDATALQSAHRRLLIAFGEAIEAP